MAKKKRPHRKKKGRRNSSARYFITVMCCALVGIGSARLADCSGQSHAASGSDSSAGRIAGLDHVKMPRGVPSVVKEYEGFRLSFNPDNGTPNWVAWELLTSETDGPATRSNKFWHDDEVEGCPYPSDYTRSGFDRGHLCPAADCKWSPEAMADCFTMANMAPQDHALNSGAWATLEAKERLWAQRDSAIVIVAGPIYEHSDSRRIGESGVRVPSAFFKVMVAPYLDQPRGIAFIYPNMHSPGNMQQYVVSIDEVEQITGFDFFASLPDDIESEIEKSSSFKTWNFSRPSK